METGPLLTVYSFGLMSALWFVAEGPTMKSTGSFQKQLRSSMNQFVGPTSPHSLKAPLFTYEEPQVQI